MLDQVLHLSCMICGATYAPADVAYVCPDHGNEGILDVVYDYYMIGENLAAGQATPAQVMADWMESAGHRANILEASFVELGVGVRTGGTYGTYWVQEFGRPAP